MTLYICLSGDFSTRDPRELVKHHNKQHKEFNKMAFDFDDESKQVKEFSESIPFGISKVQFTGAIADKTEDDKDFIEVGVVNAAGTEDSARLWFTGGASNISFNTARQIAILNGKDEEEKAKIRDRVDAVKNTDELTEVLNDVCQGGELWFTKYYDPNKTYTTENGTFRSINRNVLGYEPKPKPELMPNAGGTASVPNQGVENMPLGGTQATGDAAANIPSSWAK